MTTKHSTALDRATYLAPYLCDALNAKSGIDFLIASMALEARQEIRDMAQAAMDEIEANLNIQAAW